MLASFCLRLACGLIAGLTVLSPAQINPRFFRTHFLTALGLSAVTVVLARDSLTLPAWLVMGAVLLLSFLGSFAWSLEGAPGGRLIIFAVAGLLVAGLVMTTRAATPDEGSEIYVQGPGWMAAGELTSAALLGTSTTAMLMGHSYLIAPAMSLTPLMRLLVAMFAALFARASLGGFGLWSWTIDHGLGTLNDVTILLPLRWGLGVLAPLILGIMAWQTARIRSTQSATGILYVVVIFVFLGELISQLLYQMTGFVL